MDIPNFETMPTADLLAFHRNAAGLAGELLDDLKELHHGEHFNLFWPNLPSPIPDLDAALRFGADTYNLVGGTSALIMQVAIAGDELNLRRLPN
jgi:hypothetical protein